MDDLSNAPVAAPAPVPAVEPVVEPAQRSATGVSAVRILDVCGRVVGELGEAFASTLIRSIDMTPMSEAELSDKVTTALAEKRKLPAIDARVGSSVVEGEGYRSAVEEALLHRADPKRKLSDDAKQFRGMSLFELARQYVEGTGTRTGGLNRERIAEIALGIRAGAQTSSDFANALTNVARVSAVAGYAAAPRTFEPFVRMATLPDLEEHAFINLLDAPDLLLVEENAEIKYGSIGDTGEKVQLKTYARIVALTRRVILGDRYDMFTRLPQMFGRSAADLESDVVYGVLTGNPTMADGQPLFSAAHGNLAAVGSAITIAALGAARAAMRKQKGRGSRLISVNPVFLIVGPDKEVEAQQVVAAVTANTTAGINPFAGSLTLIVDPRIVGNQWFLAGDPAALDTILAVRLEGQEDVFLDERVGFNVDGIEHKARHDFTAKAADYPGLYMNPGA